MQYRKILPTHACRHLSIAILVWSAILVQVVVSLAPKLYLTASQSSILLPQLFIDQTIHTEYTIEGTSITIHEPMEIIQKYNQNDPLSLAVNSDGEALVRMSHTIPDIVFMYYISADQYIHFCHVGRALEELTTFHVDWGEKIEQIELVREHEVIIWSNRIMGVLRLFPSQNNSYTHQTTILSLPSSFALRFNKCSYFKQHSYLCFTNENIIQIQQTSGAQGNVLSLAHILTPPQPLRCLVNIYRLEDNLIGLCDCALGCYNYRIVGNKLEVLTNIQMINEQKIIVMKETEGGPKTVTMAVASSNILALMRWGQDQIRVVDSMLLPDVEGGQLWDIEVSGDNICLMYRNQANPTYITFEHIFIRYDSIRMQYDQLNSIIEGPYIYPHRRLLYHIADSNVLSLRLTNPYNIRVEYEPAPRSIIIKAFNTGKRAKPQDGLGQDFSNETVEILITNVKIDEVYMKENISHVVQMNYQYTYPMELYQIFIGRVRQFVLTEQFIPLLSNDTYREEGKVLNNFQDYRILSIYNLLQCVRLINVGGWAFRRLMASPNNKIYIEQCKSQKTQNNGDFICQLQQIVDSILEAAIQKGVRSWRIKDVVIEGSRTLLQIWGNSQQTVIVTKFQSHRAMQQGAISYLILPSNHMIISTHNATGVIVSLLSIKPSNHSILTQLNIQLPASFNPAIGYNKLTDINCELKYENLAWWEYKVGVGYRAAFNRTLVFVVRLIVEKQAKSSMNMARMEMDRLVQVEHYSAFFRIYSDYLYSFNSTHVIKYSLLSLAANKLYTHHLEIRLGNPLQFVRNVGQYMLLVYAHSYKILNLEGQLIELVIDDESIEEKSVASERNGLGNIGIYDMIIFGSGTLLLGINNVMRAYDRNLLFTIGPYSMQIGRIRTHHALSLSAYSASASSQRGVITQNFSLIVDYETSLIEIRGKAIKLLRHLPYSATNETVIVWENMFIGPIEQYYIADLYDGAVVLLNHIQKIFDTNPDDGSEPINRWITAQTTQYMGRWEYKLAYQIDVDHAHNTDSTTHAFLYSNQSHVGVVFLSSGELEIQVAVPGWKDCQKFEYFSMSEASFIVGSRNCIAYINPSSPTNPKKRRRSYSATTVNLALKYNLNILEFSPTRTTIYLILNQTLKQSEQSTGVNERRGDQSGKLAIIKYREDPSTAHLINTISAKAIRGVWQVVFFVGKISVETDKGQDYHSSTVDDFLCVMSIDLAHKNCSRLSDLIPAAYYKSRPDSYFKMVAISTPSPTQTNLLLLSHRSSSYHLQVLATWTLNSQGIQVTWQITNCYVGLPAYEAIQYIGMYGNGSVYDYFVLQYREMDSAQPEGEDERTETVLVFYRFNDEFDMACGNVAGWVQVGNQAASIANVADPQFYPDIQHQSLMFTTDEVFHLYKNLSFVLNYSQPPTTKYTVIYARNPSFYNKFYSKLSYEPDPFEAYFWVYCWVGFGCVAFILLIIKIVSLLIDRGVIRLSSSLSSDDDSVGSPGVTVHFSSGGMLTQENSYKSMDS